MSAHILDRPVWNALTTRQTQFALGGEHARRFQPDIGPLTSAKDDSAQALSELAELVRSKGVLLLQSEPIVVPPGLTTVSTATGVQMIAERLIHSQGDASSRIEPLSQEDWREMHALATLTKPGPFESGTPRLGEFFGIKENGRILAMAGERMKMPGFEEVSGVCVHPDARGRGFARELSAFVAGRILDRGAVPFLHSYSTNAAAISLYESLGFRVRSAVNVAALAKAVPLWK
jgi:predicted GNAT family acetyltransferase